MTPSRDRRWLVASIAALAVLLVDQATKAVVQQTMALNETIPLLPVLSLTYVRNPGAAFGLLGGLPDPVRLPVLLVVTAGAFWVLAGLLQQATAQQRATHVAVGCVFGGAAGNLVCRLRYGAVIDFVHLHWGEWYWPMFNVADSAITVGIAIILLSSLRATSAGDRPRAT